MTLGNLGSSFTRERLFTPEGGFVAEVVVPEMQNKPEVLIWGARVFIHIDSYELVEFEPLPGIEAAEGCYIEAFAYHCPPEMHHSTLPGGLDREPPRIAPDHYVNRLPELKPPSAYETHRRLAKSQTSETLRLAIEDAQARIASNPMGDARYIEDQTAKITAWQEELESRVGDLGEELKPCP